MLHFYSDFVLFYSDFVLFFTLILSCFTPLSIEFSDLDWSSIGMKVSQDAGADITADLERNLKGLK